MQSIVNEAKRYTGLYQKPRLSVLGVAVFALFALAAASQFRDAPGDLYKIGASAFACSDRESLAIAEAAVRSADDATAIEAGCLRLAEGAEVRRLRGTSDADLVLHWRIETPDGRALWTQRGWLRNPDGSLVR